MFYHVINVFKGSYSVQGTYKARDSAQRRADSIQGGETHVFKSPTREPEKALEEFREEEVKKL